VLDDTDVYESIHANLMPAIHAGMTEFAFSFFLGGREFANSR